MSRTLRFSWLGKGMADLHYPFLPLLLSALGLCPVQGVIPCCHLMPGHSSNFTSFGVSHYQKKKTNPVLFYLLI